MTALLRFMGFAASIGAALFAFSAAADYDGHLGMAAPGRST